MVPEEESQYLQIVKVLQYFNWNWIGLIAPSNENGERFLRAVAPVMASNGICVAFSQSISEMVTYELSFFADSFRDWKQVKALVYYVDSRSLLDPIMMVQHIIDILIKPMVGKVWLTTAWWDVMRSGFNNDFFEEHIHGSLSLVMRANARPLSGGLHSFVMAIHRFWKRVFRCFDLKSVLAVKGHTRCTEEESLKALTQKVFERPLKESLHSYIIFNAVHMVAHALNAALSSRTNQMAGGKRSEVQRVVQPWQVSTTLLNCGVVTLEPGCETIPGNN